MCTIIAKSSDRCEFDSLPLDSTVTAVAEWNVLERRKSSSEGTELCSFSERCLLGLMTECHMVVEYCQYIIGRAGRW